MTQPELNALFASLAGELWALGIPLSKDIDPQPVVNTRAQRRLGCCVHREGRYTIQVSQSVLDNPPLLRATLAHELLHTCPGCRNHGERWKSYAQRMNQAYGYQIRRTSACEELQVPDVKPVRHLLVCQSCGREFPRATASVLVRHPERYRCRCGGTLRRLY